MQTEAIRFFHRGAIQAVDDLPVTRTVLQYLREDLHRTGTKEGCAEGDCGACTVVVGELDDQGEVVFKAVNACIQLLPTLDGQALFTVEDLRQPDGRLHPVQQALVDCHGSQCGFCTPGFAMSMWALYQQRPAGAPPPTRAEIDDALSGNLCRCTGYRPIIEATRRMSSYPRQALDRASLAAILRGLRRDAAFVYRATDARGPAYGMRTFHAPLTLDALAQLRAEQPGTRVLGGGTDIGLWITKQFRDPGDLLYVGKVAQMRAISVDHADNADARSGADAKADAGTYTRANADAGARPDANANANDGYLTIGAAASLEDAFAALATAFPPLGETWRRFASRPIRNAGTLGGNIANGSPIGDSMPPLIALGAMVVLRHREAIRAIPLEDFFLAYQTTALAPGEFVQALRVPRPRGDLRFRAYKLSKRRDQDISAVYGAFALRIDDGRIAGARVAFGGMAATPRRAPAAEAALLGRPWTETTARAAMAALDQDYQPLSDMRASREYRRDSARQLLLRFYLETRDDAPLAAPDVDVFAADAIGTGDEP